MYKDDDSNIARKHSPVEKQVGPIVIEQTSKTKRSNSDDDSHIRNEIAVTIDSLDGLKKTMLPFCGPDYLLSPDAIVRGSLFGLGTHEVIQRKVEGKWTRIRKRLQYPQGSPKQCGEFGSVRISYIGEALDQGDLDIWLRLLDLAKNDFTKVISISFNQLISQIGRSNGGFSYNLIDSSLERLSTGHIKLQNGDIKIIDGAALIKFYRVNEKTGHAEITLNSDIARLFSTEKNLSWTRLQKQHREALVGRDLALWLHAFYSSHAKPIPFKLSVLYALSGSRSDEREFKRMLTKKDSGALDALKEIGFLVDWKVEDNILSVIRNKNTIPSSQLNFVKRKAGK